MAYLQTGTTEQQRKAIEIRGEFNRNVAAIRASTTLNDAGKREAIQNHYDRAAERLTTLATEDARTTADRKRKLERDLFGLSGTADSSTAISYRDAQDRVAAIDGSDQQQAVRLLTQAERSGDNHLAKAVALRAFEEGWVDVLNSYADSHPGTEAKIQELLDMQPNNSSAALAAVLGAAMTYELPRPAELGRGPFAA